VRVVVKLGGASLETKQTLGECTRAIASLSREGHSVAVVHGGGAALTRTLERLGKQSTFLDGLRVTDAETRDVALMVLAGGVNKSLVVAIGAEGCPAVGLCGGDGLAVRATAKDATLGYVGEVSSFETRWLQMVWREGGVPVLASLAVGPEGAYYNVNADQMAATCAVALGADALFVLTDVAGVRGPSGAILASLDLEEIDALVRGEHVRGGMLPKLAACRHAVRHGVSGVRILPASKAGLLPELLASRTECGTEVRAA